ncbi:unnamed protein product [Adineta steineri]|uniref:Uncharacterized protein n=1 Tax=Adineta steineri TaxID=433720 RepID=A0A818GFK0_9BILA|nr:unnamed protein product [Adineta steineri]CAF3489521.1 unnamed protein product [Adineta steineri]
MKTITVAFIFILTLSLVFIIDANPRRRRSNSLQRDELLDYLLESQRRELYQRRQELEQQIRRRMGNTLDFDGYNDDDDYERTEVRRKAVGLGDNPFK